MTPMEQSERKGLVERLPELRKIAEAVHHPFKWYVAADLMKGHAMEPEDACFIDTFDALTVLSLLDLLSSDARPAPMAEEVKAALGTIADFVAVPMNREGPKVLAACDLIVTHIDILTRKVAEAERQRDGFARTGSLVAAAGEKATYDMSKRIDEATSLVRNAIYNTTHLSPREDNGDHVARIPSEWLKEARAFLAGQPLSRPQETDAVLAERESCELDVLRERAKWPQRSEGYIALTRAAERVRSRPSPGPATETDRKDGWWVSPQWKNDADGMGAALMLGSIRAGYVYASVNGGWLAETCAPQGYVSGTLTTREEAQAVLLAFVRPKQEGV